MNSGPLTTVVRHLHRLAADESPPDGRLLDDFVERGDEGAFAALVRRHGPLVLGVCRRLLRDGHLAEDAFQATFLVLLRRARSLDRQRSLAGWLHTVAYHVALRARAGDARRRAKEAQVQAMPRTDPATEPVWSDLQPLLDAELNRLPENYRLPLVLCYLDGKTNAEAARLLGWPAGTVKSRLARARDLLRRRLQAHELHCTGTGLAVALAGGAAAPVAAALVDATVRTAVRVSAGAAATAGVGALADGILKAMLVARLKLTAAGLVLLAILAVGLGLAGAEARGHPQATPAAVHATSREGARPAAGAAPAALAPAAPQKREDVFALRGKVVGPDGKAVAGAKVVVMTAPWRYIQHGEPRFGAGHEILAQGTAGGDGTFALRVPRDRWAYAVQAFIPAQILAVAPGFGLTWQPQVLRPPTGKGEADVTLRLPKEEAVEGRLIDLQGRPATGVELALLRVGARPSRLPAEHDFFSTWDGLEETAARVGLGVEEGGRITSFRPARGLQFWVPPGRVPCWPEFVTTDADGRFRVAGVGRDHGLGLLVQDERYARQLLDVEPAAKRAKEPQGSTLRLFEGALRPPQRLEGTVLAADTGKPLAGALVQVDARVGPQHGLNDMADWKGRRYVTRGYGFYDFETLFTPAVRTDAEGRFSIDPYLGGAFTVTVMAPDGLAYQTVERQFTWPRGAERHRVELRLSPGVLVRGKVTDKDSGKPVARARVDFWSKGLAVPAGVVFPGPRTCGADGSFRVVLPPGKWHVLFNAPLMLNGIDPPYEAEKVAVGALATNPDQIDLTRGAPLPLPDRAPHCCYPCAWRLLELRAGAAPVNVAVALRRKAGD